MYQFREREVWERAGKLCQSYPHECPLLVKPMGTFSKVNSTYH